MSSHAREWTVGTHHAWLEPPNILWTKVRGHTSLADAVALLEIYRELGAQRPIIVVTDLSEATSVDLTARDHVSWNLRMEWFQASVYIGASLSQRAVASSMTFLHSLRGKASRIQHFVSTPQEAREFIAQERSLHDTRP
ncbi:MAG TPA: hypothetical protein VF794_20975 [Archangium sp.]|jgi:hypothetical protein|uniref:hypothetical protein n=1 Tax=Archangium sp. TaxID=1872627 RepID=UPI002EDB27F2